MIISLYCILNIKSINLNKLYLHENKVYCSDEICQVIFSVSPNHCKGGFPLSEMTGDFATKLRRNFSRRNYI